MIQLSLFYWTRIEFLGITWDAAGILLTIFKAYIYILDRGNYFGKFISKFSINVIEIAFENLSTRNYKKRNYLPPSSSELARYLHTKWYLFNSIFQILQKEQKLLISPEEEFLDPLFYSLVQQFQHSGPFF